MVHGAAGETSFWEKGPARTQGRWKHESEALKVGQGRSQAPQGKVRERGRGSIHGSYAKEELIPVFISRVRHAPRDAVWLSGKSSVPTGPPQAGYKWMG